MPAGAILGRIAARWKEPSELYENGLVVYPPRGGPGFYYPFSAVRQIDELTGPFSGDHYMFRTHPKHLVFQMPRGRPFGDRVARQARAHMRQTESIAGSLQSPDPKGLHLPDDT